MTEEDLIAALSGAGLACIQNQDVFMQLEYSWETLAIKYNASMGRVRNFFDCTPETTKSAFDMQVSASGLSYKSRFKVSVWVAFDR